MKRMTQKAKQQDQHWKMLMISAQSGDADAYDELLSAVAPFIRSIVLRTVYFVSLIDSALREIGSRLTVMPRSARRSSISW